jgi:hypothetical protein
VEDSTPDKVALEEGRLRFLVNNDGGYRLLLLEAARAALPDMLIKSVITTRQWTWELNFCSR